MNERNIFMILLDSSKLSVNAGHVTRQQTSIRRFPSKDYFRLLYFSPPLPKRNGFTMTTLCFSSWSIVSINIKNLLIFMIVQNHPCPTNPVRIFFLWERGPKFQWVRGPTGVSDASGAITNFSWEYSLTIVNSTFLSF